MKQVTLVDNRDGSPAEVTVNMTFEDIHYTWDLSNANLEKLQKALKPWLDCAEEVPVEVRPKKSRAAKSSTNGRSRDIRAWAAENGFQVAPRGRIHADVVAAFEEVHS